MKYLNFQTFLVEQAPASSMPTIVAKRDYHRDKVATIGIQKMPTFGKVKLFLV